MNFKNVAIICRQSTDGVTKTLTDLIDYIKSKKINVALEYNTSKIIKNNHSIPVILPEELGNYCDLIIVVGGDGSILSASRIAAKQNLPIVGVNLGRLGFLSDIAPKNIAKVGSILKGNFCEEKRFLIAATAENNNKTARNIALNDIVFLSQTSGNIINFSVYVDEQFLCTYHADGLIIATPTGSTAHALSGGGPILHPDLEVIVLVPMLSHNLSSRPIALKNNSIIKLIFNETTASGILIRYDGQIQETSSSTVIINKAQEKLRLLHPTDYNYFETLRTKLHWEVK